MPFYNGSYYDPDTGTYMNASPVIEALNGAYLTRSIDRNGLMCNNVVEFSVTQQKFPNGFGSLSTMTASMLPALPWYFIYITALSNLRSPLGKISKGIGFALIALDLGVNIYNSIRKEYSWAQGITSFVLTAAKDIGVYFLSATIASAVGKKIGAWIGGTLGGPVGLILGAGIGFAVGWLVDTLGTMFIDWLIGIMK